MLDFAIICGFLVRDWGDLGHRDILEVKYTSEGLIGELIEDHLG